jgi:hypothetical protein
MANNIAISDVDLAELRSLYPLCNFDVGFTAQQERFLLYTLRGMPPGPAATAAGYASGSTGNQLLEMPKIQAALDMLRAREFADIRITRDKLNGMLLEAHAKAATATEEIAAIRELGKMNGLYAPEQKVNVNVNHEVKNLKQLQQLDDEKLIELAGDAIVLDPSQYEIRDVEPTAPRRLDRE